MKGQAWYVRAQRLDQSHKLASGPFDDQSAAWCELSRIRDRYDDATLSVVLHRSSHLPDVFPRLRPSPVFDLRTVSERRAAGEALVSFVHGLGLRADIEDWDGEPDVTARTPHLSATIGLDYHRAAPMPIISWFGAAQPLRQYLRGAWGQLTDYAPMRGKATSTPDTWPELFDALEIGLLASIDGSAFE